MHANISHKVNIQIFTFSLHCIRYRFKNGYIFVNVYNYTVCCLSIQLPIYSMVSSNYISHIGIQNCRGWGTMYIASKITGLVITIILFLYGENISRQILNNNILIY